ncbi:hypothetical protein B0F90DRAFT_536916 [Multifurca ochricompacta]|uniref:Uncharacterized protein n=1 Tax=Multifurca ochricompacta TaxID=376703 RepID=A0AAD4MBR7_9AGAM|nr:hypothetical protein B0F90DRAFT_536916 [Multifurca ochricompacta]
MAQQLAAGSQPQSQRQLPQAIPQISHGRQSLSTQQTVASAIANTRNAPLQIYNHGQFYNKANTNDVASQHGQFYRSHTTDQHRARVPMTSVQQQPHYPTLNASAHFANPTVYPQCNTDRVVHPTGGAGIVPASTLHDSQVMRASYVPPKSQYPHYPGVVTTSPQARVGQGVVSGVTAGQDVGNLYPSWVKAYGVETAASMTRDILQSRQLRQVVPVTPAPTTASLDSVSVQNPQNQSQFQIMKQEPPTGVGPILLPLDPPRQEWHPEVRVISVEERLAPSQARPTALHNIVSHQLSDTDNTPLQADVTQGIAGQSELVNMSDVHNNGEVQSHYLGATASNAVLTSTDITSGLSTPLRSQPGSTQSILLASEKKSTALYTIRGLAASVQRSLNAERLGASTEPSATSGLPTVKRMRSTSAGAIDATGATKFKLSGSESHEQGPVPK